MHHSKRGEPSVPITDLRFLAELLSLNRGHVSFILGDLHPTIDVPDTRRKAVAASGFP